MKFDLKPEQLKKLEGLIEESKKALTKPMEYIRFTKIKEADDLLNNIEEYSHLFVLGCIMDRQINSERAWEIPYQLMKELGGFEFERLLKLDLNKIEDIFSKNKFHRFNRVMANNFYLAIKLINEKYEGNASNIWIKESSSAAVIRKFLEFEGIGQKIANMAVNILFRQLKINLKDLSAIDISADTHVIRMMKNLGFAPENASKDFIIFRAKEFYPEYPGLLDKVLFEMGRAERRKNIKKDE